MTGFRRSSTECRASRLGPTVDAGRSASVVTGEALTGQSYGDGMPPSCLGPMPPSPMSLRGTAPGLRRWSGKKAARPSGEWASVLSRNESEKNGVDVDTSGGTNGRSRNPKSAYTSCVRDESEHRGTTKPWTSGKRTRR